MPNYNTKKRKKHIKTKKNKKLISDKLESTFIVKINYNQSTLLYNKFLYKYLLSG